MKDIIILVVFKQIECVLYFTFFFFSFLYCCNFKFIEICKYSTSALYPDLSVVNILSYLLYQSHSRSLSAPHHTQMCGYVYIYIYIMHIHVCIYITYIYREREMGRKKTFPFTLSQCGFPRNMVSLFCDHSTMIIIRECNVDTRLSSNLQSSFCIFKASLEKAGMGQRW